ncbi:MAG: N-acetyl-gamma-glutamyl-phosphate reductase [Planctomycetes bacterium]|nr:N-acetyl-gamma-glutamyl-phosphate reductase [Planctomycetota bacterium]
MPIRAAILGPTGYTGLYLIQGLLRHPGAELTYLASHRETLPNIADEFPQLLGQVPEQVAVCRPIDPDAIARSADVAFLALPHRAAMSYAPVLLDAGLRVIDLSADYRLTEPALYQKAYGHPHEDVKNLADAVYGLPELFRDDLPGAMLVANPGCYPTASALAIAPLLSRSLVKPDGIVINAASGVTGAGRVPAPHLHFVEQNESFMAYGVIGGHRHQPEIEQTLAIVAGRPVSLLFVPHLLPIDRGILATIYLEPASGDVTQDDLLEAYRDAYRDDPFIRLRKDPPNVKHVRDTNFCDLCVRLIPGPTPRVVVFSAIDNMIKGASGQAIQNMNLVFEQEETAGLL